MAVEKDNYNDIGRLLPPDVSVINIHRLCLHYILIHDIRETLKLKLDFGRGIEFTFNERKRLYDRENCGPILYSLELKLIKDNNGQQLYVEHCNDFKSVGEYYLTCSHDNIKHEEQLDNEYSLYEYFDSEHLFIFNIHFQPSYGFRLPGKKNFSNTNKKQHEHYFLYLVGEDSKLFTNLCLFTSFLLHDKKYNLFNTILEQFQITLSKENYTFNRHDFQDFFDNCSKYININISKTSQDDFIIFKIIIRMLGLLIPLNNESFDQNSISAQQFIRKLAVHVQTNFRQLLNIVDKHEWSLFKNGLALLLSFELVYQQIDHLQPNTLILLYQINNQKQRQEIANELLQQLHKQQQPLSINSNWTDLFTLVDPEIINIKQLDLADTFESFISCITKISTVLQVHHQFEQDISDYFENRVFYNHLQSKSIIYILIFFFTLYILFFS